LRHYAATARGAEPAKGKKMTEKLENKIRLFEKDLAKILKKVKQ
jgi:hypothetical protein